MVLQQLRTATAAASVSRGTVHVYAGTNEPAQGGSSRIQHVYKTLQPLIVLRVLMVTHHPSEFSRLNATVTFYSFIATPSYQAVHDGNSVFLIV